MGLRLATYRLVLTDLGSVHFGVLACGKHQVSMLDRDSRLVALHCMSIFPVVDKP